MLTVLVYNHFRNFLAHIPYKKFATRGYICKFPVVYMCERQSYCKNCQAYFFGPPCVCLLHVCEMK